MPEVELIWGSVGRVIPLRPGANCVGRGPGNDIPLDEPLLSKHHLRIWCEGGVRVEDRGSKNGSVLDGQPMLPRTSYPVHEGGLVELGRSVRLRFRNVREASPWDPGAEVALEAMADRLRSLEAMHPELAGWVRDDLLQGRLERDAFAHALEHLEALAMRSSQRERLKWLVDVARRVTGAPTVWALRWSVANGEISYRDLVADADQGEIPEPTEVSRTLVGDAVSRQVPLWIDDAQQDDRFRTAESVCGHGLHTVGCVPLGRHGVLYVSDPTRLSLWDAPTRAYLASLCRVVDALGVATEPRVPMPSVTDTQPELPQLMGMFGRTQPMVELAERAQAFARFVGNILVLGEQGTGKTQLARAIHEHAGRGRFVHVNVANFNAERLEADLFGWKKGAFTGATADQEGFVHRAAGGTLFLDEIGDLAPELQAKLLTLTRERLFRRVGSTREEHFDGRIIAATNKPIDDRDRMPTFRQDLYVRLSEMELRVPTLAERRDDVPLLVHHFVDRFCAENAGVFEGRCVTVSPAALELVRQGELRDHVAGLERLVKRACIQAFRKGSLEVRVEHVRAATNRPAAVLPDTDTPYDDAVDAFEIELLTQALETHDGNKSRAARHLGMTRAALLRKLKRLGLMGTRGTTDATSG